MPGIDYVEPYEVASVVTVNKTYARHRMARSGSAVECLTRDREAAGSTLTGVT